MSLGGIALRSQLTHEAALFRSKAELTGGARLNDAEVTSGSASVERSPNQALPRDDQDTPTSASSAAALRLR